MRAGTTCAKYGAVPKFEKKITLEQRSELVRRALAGENMAQLGREFGVTRAYVSLLRQQARDPEGFERKKRAQLDRILTKRLSEAERAAFLRELRSAVPSSLIPGSTATRWTVDEARDLAHHLYGKKPGYRFLQECLEEAFKGRRRA